MFFYSFLHIFLLLLRSCYYFLGLMTTDIVVIFILCRWLQLHYIYMNLHNAHG